MRDWDKAKELRDSRGSHEASMTDEQRKSVALEHLRRSTTRASSNGGSILDLFADDARCSQAGAGDRQETDRAAFTDFGGTSGVNHDYEASII